ncbi:DNA processing protein DprA [Siminovitchia terrae]|uniref:DNA processing protein DprA n=1 Tax=Siminovitchia terrae TaxID=1914933 RepID=A0A429X8I4_SIMTE|nr:DNA-processing protein DprA [Siminovitchia terrae]RST59692.1 DNA processing protein DprA [Siminovitchia terrae]
MSSNVNRNMLLLLKQFGFSDNTLDAIYNQEESILEVIYDENHIFHNKYFDIYTEKEKELANNLNLLLEFEKKFIDKMNDYKKMGIKIFFKYSDDFPKHIFPVGKEPLFLYSYGNTELLEQRYKKAAIIGTRKSTIMGETKTKEYVKEYVKKGWVTISGLAKGIDTVVHKETLNYGGLTIAILPTSFEKIYPAQNKGLFQKIIEKGGLALTTIGPFENTYKSSFLDRNIIVAKMSDEILIIEASIKSGTLNTVRNGFYLGKPIYYNKELLSEEVIKYIAEYNAVEYQARGE